MSTELIGVPDTCINCGQVHLPGECLSSRPQFAIHFTLDTVMDALGDAFARAGSRTDRDARVEEYLRENLSARLDTSHFVSPKHPVRRTIHTSRAGI